LTFTAVSPASVALMSSKLFLFFVEVAVAPREAREGGAPPLAGGPVLF